MQHLDDTERVWTWVCQCLPGAKIHSCHALIVKKGKEREVWECRFVTDGVDTAAVLTIFKPGNLRSVNTSLPPAKVANKCALAMVELPSFDIPTPSVMGQATAGGQAAVLCEKIETITWTPGIRVEAARILAKIHTLSESSLSISLQHLTRISDPRENRTTGGQAPQPRANTLVHGDYFSANILPVPGGVRIINWETFGWGDPMWDLGFLVGADRTLPDAEIEATINAYAKYACEGDLTHPSNFPG